MASKNDLAKKLRWGDSGAVGIDGEQSPGEENTQRTHMGKGQVGNAALPNPDTTRHADEQAHMLCSRVL